MVKIVQQTLIIDGKKLSLNLEVMVLRLLHHISSGSSVIRLWPGWCRFLMLAAFL